MKALCILSVLVLVLYEANCLTYDENTYFISHIKLNQQYKVYWNTTKEDITFKIVVQTDGWVSFGFSANGGMYNADIMMAWKKINGGVEFKDAHIERSSTIWVDKTLFWKQLYYSQKNGVTTVIFTRKIKVCNPYQDPKEINIDVSDSNFLVFSYGTNFIADFPTYHGPNRGSKLIPLLTKNNRVELNMDDIEILEFQINATITRNDTSYICQLFQLPDDFATTKRHLVRYETVLEPGHEKYVHHWLIMECSSSFENYVTGSEECFSRDYFHTTKKCRKNNMAWATGGNLIIDFPEDKALPFGGSVNASKFFVLQVHYENSFDEKITRDTTKIRLYLTKKYRPIEFGILTIGQRSLATAISIPPKMKNITFESLCTKNFFQKLPSDINVFAHLPHTHLQGRELYTSIVRDKKEIEYISYNKYYDNDFQYVNYLNGEKTILRTDEVFVKCVYNTEDKDTFTVGGLGTQDEMCLDFLWYYPRQENVYECDSEISGENWYFFFDYLERKGYIKWTWKPINGDETFFSESFENIMASQTLTPDLLQDLFEGFMKQAPRLEYHDKQRAGLPRLINFEPIKKETCEITLNNSSNTRATMIFPYLLSAFVFIFKLI